MGKKARDYKISTLKRLYALSGNTCANPICNNSLLGYDELTMVDEIVHIEAANPNGPRYNSAMEDDDRRSFDNLILLCQSCHKIVDSLENSSKYGVEILKEWKKDHESKQKMKNLKDLNLLKIAVKAISEAEFEQEDNNNFTLKAVNPEEKIRYNSIKRNKSLIDEYKAYYSKINMIYTELEKHGSFKKEKLLRNIKSIYLRIVGNYVLDNPDKMAIIRENADNIFEDIQEELTKLVSGNEVDASCYFEILVIMVDAFIRCKILEEPQ